MNRKNPLIVVNALVLLIQNSILRDILKKGTEIITTNVLFVTKFYVEKKHAINIISQFMKNEMSQSNVTMKGVEKSLSKKRD